MKDALMLVVYPSGKNKSGTSGVAKKGCWMKYSALKAVFDQMSPSVRGSHVGIRSRALIQI